MTSPLFKSLPIGSLRYWSEPINVIATYIYKNAYFTLEQRKKFFTLNKKTLSFVLQNKRITVNLRKTLKFTNRSEVVNYELC